jgi:O-antigen/teichoic acid export membrane protein
LLLSWGEEVALRKLARWNLRVFLLPVPSPIMYIQAMAILPARLFTGTIVSSMGRVVGTVISILTIAVMTRALVAIFGVQEGVRVYGVYAAVMAYLSIVSVFADGGIYTIFTREASRDGADEKRLFETAWVLRLITIVATVVGALLLAVLLPYSQAIRFGMLVGIWGIVFQLASQLFMGIFQKKLRLWAPAIGEVAGRAAQLLAVLVFGFWGLGINYFILAFVLGAAVTFWINLAAARKLTNFNIFAKAKKSDLLKMWREAMPMGIVLVLSVIFFKIDSVLLSFLRPASDLAYYALAYKILESLLFFPAMVGGMLMPIFSRLGTERASNISPVMRTSVDLYMMGVLPLCGTLWILAPQIIAILGGEAFSPAVPALRILALALGALFFGNLFGNAVVAIGKQKLFIYIYVVLIILNVVLNLIFIPRYSFIGAAWTTLVCEILSTACAVFIIYRSGVGVIGTKRTPKIFLASLLFLTILAIPLNPIPKIVIGIIFYIGFLFWLRALEWRHILFLFYR